MISRIRKGVSPVIATVIIITVTLLVGFAVFSFVNSEAAVASGAMGQSTANYVNYLRERFVITNVAFNYPSNGMITVWFYNNGAIDTKIVKMYIGTDLTELNSISFTPYPLSLPIKQTGYLTINYSDDVLSGTYYIKAVGGFGNVVLYYQMA